MDGTQIRALIVGYISSSNEAKQRLGRCFAVELGLDAGPLGQDEGIDGSGYTDDGRKIYFQCKLRGKSLGKADAKEFYKNIQKSAADVGIMLAGIGYKRTFKQQLSEYLESQDTSIHYLTLQDILEKTFAFEEAAKDLPKINNLSSAIESEEKSSEL